MLIHGARSVFVSRQVRHRRIPAVGASAGQRAPRNKVVVAIANKLARIAWAVLSSGRNYRHQPLRQLAAA
jgi:transposase